MFEGEFVCLFVFVGHGTTSRKLCQKTQAQGMFGLFLEEQVHQCGWSETLQTELNIKVMGGVETKTNLARPVPYCQDFVFDFSEARSLQKVLSRGVKWLLLSKMNVLLHHNFKQISSYIFNIYINQSD